MEAVESLVTNTVMVTFYEPIDFSKIRSILEIYYNEVIIYREYTLRGITHWHALAHGKKQININSVSNIRDAVRRRYKKIDNKVIFNKYNFNIIIVSYPAGYAYVTKSGIKEDA